MAARCRHRLTKGMRTRRLSTSQHEMCEMCEMCENFFLEGLIWSYVLVVLEMASIFTPYSIAAQFSIL